ncbi:MAG: DUF2357 domain-containing protein [Clostridia bacterium]|nr:DUF2357 domain-containing protein [Clostridia bacterium]
MAIVSDLPFTLVFQIEYVKNPVDYPCKLFYDTPEEALNSDTVTVCIKENDPVSILFTGESSDRLYLDALDIIPIQYGCEIDDEGRIFHYASEEPIPLFRYEENQFDELRVDSFLIDVVAQGQHYYGWLKIEPKMLSSDEWEIMVSDLEDEANGLAQDIVQRNIGCGNLTSLAIPPRQLRQFLLFRERASRFLSSLYDIAEFPRFAIITEYVDVDRSKEVRMDAKAIGIELRKPNRDRFVKAPQKSISYDTKNNRHLKRMVNYCFSRIDEFHGTVNALLEAIDRQSQNSPYQSSTRYREVFKRNLQQYYETSKKLARIERIIANKEWYKEVSEESAEGATHSFALDPCFAYIEKVYRELKEDRFTVQIDPNYSFSWKKSSQLYEIWCLISICRMLVERYDFVDEDTLIKRAEYGVLFPYIESGTQLHFENDNSLLLISYDRKIPKRMNQCTLERDPFCYDSTDTEYSIHNRPDIRIDIFFKPGNSYIGSVIVECKYRSIKNFLGGNSYNSKEQIISYYELSKTELYFNNLAKWHDVRPVQRVIVVTPDISKTVSRSKHVKIKTLRPGDDKGIQELSKELFSIIDDRVNRAIDELREGA